MADQPQKSKHRFADEFYNTITYCGIALSILVLVCEFFLFGLDFLSPQSSVYLGIFTYIILPPFLILGLILIPIGARRKAAQVRRGIVDAKPAAIYIDPSLSTHQNAILIFMIGTTLLLTMTAIGCYKAYHYTESVRFCGLACHSIMGPEYVAYMQSPHARVSCVQCHIGEGTGSYVHYKVAGTKMLVKTIQGNYERPVPAPVRDLRPAKETCEQCHYPGKSFNAIQIKRTYFADDAVTTPKWSVQMLMNVGGKKSETGIHAHMYVDNDIYYVADDDKRQDITWVKSKDKDGKDKIYTSKNSPYKDVAPPPEKIRKMDCLDCHNRSAHHFDAPASLVNKALTDNKIDPSIPMIKGKAVDVMSKEYKTEKEAVEKIRSTLVGYYTTKQADYYATHAKEIDQAIVVITGLYQGNIFPEMKARWDAYPSNNGHMYSLGCFRCHDDEHTTPKGDSISRDCTTCHTITQQGTEGAMEKNLDGLEFKHPLGDDSWKTMNCSECHTGGS